MNIAQIEDCSFIYGPGRRFVIWVQGCSLRCKGCWNSSMWSTEQKLTYSVDELTDMICRADVEGISILGGEPLDQLDEVVDLCRRCQNSGLSTMIFTGYELSEIETTEKMIIKDVADILITGRYSESLRSNDLQWIGSTNQQIFFLTERYQNYEIQNANYVEIDIDDFGKLTILGFPEETFVSRHKQTS